MQLGTIAEKKSLKLNWPAPRPWNPPKPVTASKEQRRFPREWRSQPIWWRQPLNGEMQNGWMVDGSAEGAAFIYRGTHAPLSGTRIETSNNDPRETRIEMKDALVRRVNRLHGDLFLVAAQYAGTPAFRS